MGANLIEKHFTDKRKLKRTDFQSAIELSQINNLIDKINVTRKTFKIEKKINRFEKKYRNMFKKSPAINKSIINKDIINKGDINFIKSSKKHSFMFSHQLFGKQVNQDINKGSLITPNKLNIKIGAIIVVRMSSNRFSGNALKKINGEHSISLVIRRVKKIKNLNEIILATTTNVEDNVFKKIAKKEKIKFYRGSLENVASRYYNCAKKYNLDHFVRITGDAILCDDEMLNKAIISHLNKQADVTFIKNMPYGTAKEVVATKTIKIITETAKQPKKTEYLEFFVVLTPPDIPRIYTSIPSLSFLSN